MRILCLLLIPFMLSGCITLFPTPDAPPRIYTLTPKTMAAKRLPKVGGLLAVERPNAGADLDTDKITIHLTPQKVDSYNRAKWIEAAPKMFQDVIVESFDKTGKITAFSSDVANLRSDYVLLLDMQEFQAEPYHCKGKTHIHVGINAKLIKMPERKLIGSNNFNQILDSDDNKMDTLVSCFDLATGNVINMLIEWVLTAIQKSRS